MDIILINNIDPPIIYGRYVIIVLSFSLSSLFLGPSVLFSFLQSLHVYTSILISVGAITDMRSLLILLHPVFATNAMCPSLEGIQFSDPGNLSFPFLQLVSFLPKSDAHPNLVFWQIKIL
jgi:hypothetical protein